MKKTLLPLVILFAAACGKGGKLDKHISKLSDYKTKMCACTTAECAEAVKAEEKKWENEVEAEVEKEYKSRSDIPKDFMEKWDAAEKPMKKCYRDLMDKAAPTPPTP
jgi:hypothetical protein